MFISGMWFINCYLMELFALTITIMHIQFIACTDKTVSLFDVAYAFDGDA